MLSRSPPPARRPAFQEAVDAVCDWIDGEPEPTVDVRDNEVSVSAVCGLLWNCNDILPSGLVGSMKSIDPDFSGWSYAGAARSLKSVIVQIE
jgi:hypothetical protein